MTHPDFQQLADVQEITDPQANMDDMPEEFGGKPQGRFSEWTVTEELNTIGGAYKNVRVERTYQNILFTGNGITENGVIISVNIDKEVK